MYRQYERKLTEKETRLIRSRIRAGEKRYRSRFQIVGIQCLIGFGIAGIICVLGKFLSEDTPPIWFFMLIFTDEIKNLIPYDQKFFDCSIDEFETYIKQNYG